MSMWEAVWVRVRGSNPLRWRRGWRKRYGVGGSDGPAMGFTWDEVASKDGVHAPRWRHPAIVRQAEALNHLRAVVSRTYEATRVEIVVHSWYRTPAHNSAVGGARYSQHLYGKASDITVRIVRTGGVRVRISPGEVARLAEQVPGFRNGGVGRYATFTHLDTRGTRARWNG